MHPESFPCWFLITRLWRQPTDLCFPISQPVSKLLESSASSQVCAIPLICLTGIWSPHLRVNLMSEESKLRRLRGGGWEAANAQSDLELQEPELSPKHLALTCLLVKCQRARTGLRASLKVSISCFPGKSSGHRDSQSPWKLSCEEAFHC